MRTWFAATALSTALLTAPVQGQEIFAAGHIQVSEMQVNTANSYRIRTRSESRHAQARRLVRDAEDEDAWVCARSHCDEVGFAEWRSSGFGSVRAGARLDSEYVLSVCAEADETVIMHIHPKFLTYDRIALLSAEEQRRNWGTVLNAEAELSLPSREDYVSAFHYAVHCRQANAGTAVRAEVVSSLGVIAIVPQVPERPDESRIEHDIASLQADFQDALLHIQSSDDRMYPYHLTQDQRVERLEQILARQNSRYFSVELIRFP